MSGRVIFGEMAAIDVLSVLKIQFLSGLPSKSKCFSFFNFSILFVKFLKIIAIRRGFFFCISKDNLWYWFFLPFPKCACSCCFGFRQLWFKDIKVIRLIFLESGVFGEGVSKGSVSPCGRGLIPVGKIFFNWDGRIVEGNGHFFIRRGTGFGWNVTTHMHGGKVAFSLFSLFHFNFIYYYF